MTDIVNYPTCQHISAMNCVDAAHLAIAVIAGHAELLRDAIAHGVPLGVSRLTAVSDAVQQKADRLDDSLSLWHRLPADSLSGSHHRSLQRQIDAIRQHADKLGHAALRAESGTPPTADQLATLADHVLALTEPLHQEIGAAHAASIAPPPGVPLH
jgi:hypothetical protein